MAVSLNPGSFVETAGAEDGLYDCTAAQFEIWDYNGQIPEPAVALHLTLISCDGERRVAEQRWTAGDAKRFRPSADGSELDAIDPNRAALSRSTNCALLVDSYFNALNARGAFRDFEQVTSCRRLFVGARFYLQSVEAPRRGGQQGQGQASAAAGQGQGQASARRVPIVTRIDVLPTGVAPAGAPAVGQANGAAPVQGAPAPWQQPAQTLAGAPAQAAEVSHEEAHEALIAMLTPLAGADGIVQKGKAVPQIYKQWPQNQPLRDAVKKLWDAGYLQEAGLAEWTDEKKTALRLLAVPAGA